MATDSAVPADPAAMPMMLPELIDLLPPVPEPEAISWLPQTWGWAVLGLTLLVLLAWYGWRGYRHWQANRYRRAALQELEHRLAAGEGAVALTEVLRRTALVAFPRAEVAALSGDAWCDFLNQSTAPDKPCFDAQAIAQLSRMTYRQEAAAADGDSLNALRQRVERWIKTHELSHGVAHD
ncbi:protein of unknown function [Halopseudomonas sabulinigri]|uniref:DUF4381 domain-containing protein n=1 Tax=Halopseudomonas sabulinigri TaxID=472181 RepID=A0A1H1L8S0_9GAMM|nr:DUF4381 domain-containing protein [Halopseudomonas sabulinigri]SDR71001.1 protein of unknown function [Halopseudomonas sabulinigri]